MSAEPLLVVEEPDGTLIGAKSKEWLKQNIPPPPSGATVTTKFTLLPLEYPITDYPAALSPLAKRSFGPPFMVRSATIAPASP